LRKRKERASGVRYTRASATRSDAVNENRETTPTLLPMLIAGLVLVVVGGMGIMVFV